MITLSEEGYLVSIQFVLLLTTYLTIDTSGAHGNNVYKTAEEHFPWSGNGYKKPSAAESAKLMLFGTQRSQVRIISL